MFISDLMRYHFLCIIENVTGYLYASYMGKLKIYIYIYAYIHVCVDKKNQFHKTRLFIVQINILAKNN